MTSSCNRAQPAVKAASSTAAANHRAGPPCAFLPVFLFMALAHNALIHAPDDSEARTRPAVAIKKKQHFGRRRVFRSGKNHCPGGMEDSICLAVSFETMAIILKSRSILMMMNRKTANTNTAKAPTATMV